MMDPLEPHDPMPPNKTASAPDLPDRPPPAPWDSPSWWPIFAAGFILDALAAIISILFLKPLRSVELTRTGSAE